MLCALLFVFSCDYQNSQAFIAVMMKLLMKFNLALFQDESSPELCCSGIECVY